jgi:hypothetical protein
MKYTRGLMLGLGVFMSIFILATMVFAEGEVITTLLPTKSTPDSGQLRIAADDSDPIKSIATARLVFDLSPIPKTATIRRVTLRLVGQPAKRPANPQVVQIFPDSSDKSVGSWTATGGRSVFQALTDKLLEKVKEALKNNKETLSFTLSSRSRLSDWQYYSMAAYGGTSSNKPRLIIEYTPPQTWLDREQVSDTTKTRWKYSPQPTNVTVKPILVDTDTIISNPVFYDGGIYLFVQPSSQKTMLYALYPGGRTRWKKEIKERPGSHALVSSAGRLYSVGENRIVIYDLEKDGAEIKKVSLGDFKPALRPTLGVDGSLYAMPSGSGYIYGFNPDPQELWRYHSDKTQLAMASRLTLSPDAGRYAYVLTKVGKETHPVRITTATGDAESYRLGVTKTDNGNETEKNLDLGFTGFYRPVVIKGPQQDYVFLSAYTEQNGMLLAYSGSEVVWWEEGTVSQPIVVRGNVEWGKGRVFAVQSGEFRGYDESNGNKECASSEKGIAATSNLVKDGEDNVYFWNNGILLGYTKGCKQILSQKLAKLPENLELMFAPDGTLYARTEGNALRSITPSRANLNVVQEQLKTDTIYSAGTVHVAANLQIESEHVILKAEKSISFGTGVSVKKGASVRCRIGF